MQDALSLRYCGKGRCRFCVCRRGQQWKQRSIKALFSCGGGRWSCCMVVTYGSSLMPEGLRTYDRICSWRIAPSLLMAFQVPLASVQDQKLLWLHSTTTAWWSARKTDLHKCDIDCLRQSRIAKVKTINLRYIQLYIYSTALFSVNQGWENEKFCASLNR